MRKMKKPSWSDMIIPLGMLGGGIVGMFVVAPAPGTSEPEVRSPGDPGDALAMLGVFSMLAGAAVGTIVGVIAALALYLLRRRETKYK